MTPQQATNLRTLIRHMETKVTRTLNMDTTGICGAPACAMGEAAEIALVSWPSALRMSMFGWCRDGALAFGLSQRDEARLFGWSGCNAWKTPRVFPVEWALEARKVLAENGYSMDEPQTFQSFMERVQKGDGLPDFQPGPDAVQIYDERACRALVDTQRSLES